jgi:hypothetical protein
MTWMLTETDSDCRCTKTGSDSLSKLPSVSTVIVSLVLTGAVLLASACQPILRRPAFQVPECIGAFQINETIIVGKMAGYVVTNFGNPMRDVYVELLADNGFDVLTYTKTNRKGRFRFRGVKDGEYWIRISLEGWTTVY